MAIERPLEKKTCDEIEKQMQSGYAAFKSSTGMSQPWMTHEYEFWLMDFDSLIMSHWSSLDYDEKKALFDAEKNITETETEPIEPSIVEVRRKRAAT